MTPASRALRALLTLATATVLTGIGFSGAPQAYAANVGFSQCNDFDGGAAGATTQMDCSVVIVNTISGTFRGSTVTVTRTCALPTCPEGNTSGPQTTSSANLVTSVDQCNRSSNDSAHPVNCSVRITNNIRSDTPLAQPLSFATLDQCIGSAQGGGGSNTCSPPSASTSGARVTQCNTSANGGGGTINCSFPSDQESRALPVTINQCNHTGNKGGNVVNCSVRMTTNITAAPAASPTPASATPSAAPTRGTRVGGPPTGDGQVSRIPHGGVATGGGATAPQQRTPLLVVGLLLLVVSAGALLHGRRGLARS